VSERINLKTGEAGDRRRDAPMGVAMEMAPVETPTASVTAAGTI